jgi:hypothetical protein
MWVLESVVLHGCVVDGCKEGTRRISHLSFVGADAENVLG